MNATYLIDFTGDSIRESICGKTNFSGIDGIDKNDVAKPKLSFFKEEQVYQLSEEPNFRIGIEICLDHAQGVLRQELYQNAITQPVKWGKPKQDSRPVSLHLIVACGMDLIAEKCAAVEDPTKGFVFRCNGNVFNAISAYNFTRDKERVYPQSDVYRINKVPPTWGRSVNMCFHDKDKRIWFFLPDELQHR
jgi:hypothetical protein